MQDYIIEIHGRPGFFTRHYLKRNRFVRDGSKWSKHIDPDDAKHWQRYARRKGLFSKVRDASQLRSSNYRSEFFRVNAGLNGQHKIYRCVYCGKICGKDRITVDHVYPVDRVSSDPKVLRKMMKRGISNVNDTTNLVPACRRCNLRKGTGMGIWLLLARIGKSERLWIIRKVLRAAGFIAFVITAFFYLRNMGFSFSILFL